MTKKLHVGRLVLTPQEPQFVPPDLDLLLDRLQRIQFIAEPLSEIPGQHYLLGERFMQLVTFMGCSPSIQLMPTPDDQPFCHLSIDGPHPKPIFLHGRNTMPPRCDSCRKRITGWQDIIKLWSAKPKTFLATCPHCNHQQDPITYNWRQSAGFGRLLLCVENIFPNEAIPSPELFKALEGSEAAWHHFYIQD